MNLRIKEVKAINSLSKYISVAALSLSLLVPTLISCDDDNGDVGPSILPNTVQIFVDSTFTITGSTVSDSKVISRSQLQMIGKIENESYGFLSSDYVTQMMTANTLDTTGVEISDLDSLILVLTGYKGSYVGDSIAPLGYKVFELNKKLPANIDCSFDPSGYYDPSKPLASNIYNVSSLDGTDDEKTSEIYTFQTKLPLELGIRLFKAYKENPSNFSSPQSFINNVFNGLYIANSFGSGRVTGLGGTMMRLFYHDTYYDSEKGKDTTVVKVGNYFASAPEVISNNNISYIPSEKIKKMVADGEKLIVAPAGYEVKVRFPFDKIIEKYKANQKTYNVVNSLIFKLKAEQVSNNMNIQPPQYLLLVPTSKKKEFFATNSLPNYEDSYYAEYSSYTNTYYFGDMSSYLNTLLKKEGGVSEEDMEFSICAVDVTVDTQDSYYGSSTTVTGVYPWAAEPTMVKLLFDKSQLIFTFSVQGK